MNDHKPHPELKKKKGAIAPRPKYPTDKGASGKKSITFTDCFGIEHTIPLRGKIMID